MKLTALQESLLVLHFLSCQIRDAIAAFPRQNPADNEALKFTVSNHLQILLSSFSDEWKRVEGLGVDRGVRDSLRVASPAVKRIRTWSGLSSVRNQLLAHGLRDTQGRLVLPNETLQRFQCPTAYAETLLLGECALRAISVMFRRHQADWGIAKKQISARVTPSPERGIRMDTEIASELSRIEAQIAEIENP